MSTEAALAPKLEEYVLSIDEFLLQNALSAKRRNDEALEKNGPGPAEEFDMLENSIDSDAARLLLIGKKLGLKTETARSVVIKRLKNLIAILEEEL